MVTFNSKTKKTVFQIHLPLAQAVSLLGDFNGWNDHPLKKDKNGTWTAEIKLEPGEYQFLYRVDKAYWHPDDKAPKVPNDFSTENSLAVVKREERSVPPKPVKTVKRVTKKK